ncbi:MAG: sigma-E processing peptidase SpoIIGA, partial [Clostridia bacterium]|nr:sigma-E processing peptidase SpoIIGA [Clostridia bacterium]
SAALLLCAAGLLGGVVLSLYGATQSFALAYGTGGVCTVCIAAAALRARRNVISQTLLRVQCRYRGNLAAFDAMADSGNTLRDYLTHRPVIVMPEAQGRDVFALEGAALRPIFAETAGGRQMMYCFTPEEVCLIAGKQARRADAVVALSPAMKRDAPALVPAVLLWNEE